MVKEEKCGEDRHRSDVGRGHTAVTPAPHGPQSAGGLRRKSGFSEEPGTGRAREHSEAEPSVPSLLPRLEPGIREGAKAQPGLPEASRAETGRETGAKSRDVGSGDPERRTLPHGELRSPVVRVN